MKTKFYHFAIGIAVCALAITCKKDSTTTNTTTPQQVSVTTTFTDKTATSITMEGTIVAPTGNEVTARGFCWSSTNVNPTLADQSSAQVIGVGTFSATITNLTPHGDYWFCAYAITSAGTTYGNVMGTELYHQIVPPSISLDPITSVASMSADLYANILDTGYASITAKGFCYGTSPQPTTANTTIPEGPGYEFGYFSDFVNTLTVNTTYYFRAYATNNAGTSYSNEESLLTAYHIGEGLGGGRIFYVDNTHLHGLIASTADQDNGAHWNNTSNPFSFISAFNFDNGAPNTTNIISATGSYGNAAGICRAYTGGGYTDWYLPSVNELGLLSQQHFIIGGFLATQYWSSTATTTDNSFAYVIDMNSGGYDVRLKSEQFPIRAIRGF